ncbi:MAG TPA: ThiF family adenylyltransferase [Paenibacillus sp.]|uniref:ThiF family adenylyltransferase n=1 Tax=Paenibacillus sp. TaxID=58172 RepID=UPI002CBBB875|nr:ThiF family adenylyltransferase [Paenibacillus sp.]HUC91621.1 ThiF family adenylyltransferase [Paenibacillus sp.]
MREAAAGLTGMEEPAAEWRERYSRQIRFAPIGESGQRRLGEAAVLIVGAGALGASLAQHMVRAGVGLVRLADRDYVEPSNLQRQVLFDEEDARLALPKAVAAARRLRGINSAVMVEEHVADVGRREALELTMGVDLVLDGTDNAAARLALNDACYSRGIPLLYGGVAGAQGMSAGFIPGETACLRCVIGGEDVGDGETCDTAGVISPAVELVAALQAGEALKWLAGRREAMRGTWLSAALWPFAVREMRLPAPQPDCPVCGGERPASVERDAPSGGDREPADRRDRAAGSGGTRQSFAAAALCGRDTVQVTTGLPLELDAFERRWLSAGVAVDRNPYLLRASLDGGVRLVLFPDGRVLVQGTSDIAAAVRLCGEYVNDYETEREAGIRHGVGT